MNQTEWLAELNRISDQIDKASDDHFQIIQELRVVRAKETMSRNHVTNLCQAHNEMLSRFLETREKPTIPNEAIDQA